jgi:hypothetical protein
MRFPFFIDTFETIHIQAILRTFGICQAAFQTTAFFFEFGHFYLPGIFESII